MGNIIIFETPRLIIRQFSKYDNLLFFDMMGNSNVMNPIPLKALSKKESDTKLKEIISWYNQKSQKKVWAVSLKNNSEFVGLCGFLTNSDIENEIAFRLREKYWSLGFGTEIAEYLIKYGFENLGFNSIFGDAFVENKKSIKILEKLLIFDKNISNTKDNCVDRRYKLSKQEWIETQIS